MTEREILTAALRRLESAGSIEDVKEDGERLSYYSPHWHGYWIEFVFDDDGKIIHTAAGC